MIETFSVDLTSGATLSCRASGRPGAPVLLFLHGFPEAAFVWDTMLEQFSDRYRCVAPNLRGFEQSSSPPQPEAYRMKHLIADLDALITKVVEPDGGPLEALVAHDWGGAVAWTFAVRRPQLLKRLVIINSPHPATFLRELQHNPEQQRASAYMNFLCRPDAEKLLAENDFSRLWPMFSYMGAADASHERGVWLTDAMRDQYRAVWSAGLTGGCNYYRASPLRPPTPHDTSVMQISFEPDFVTVKVPTHVIWAEADIALLASLLDGLEAFVPNMRLVRVPGASHWIVHERPAFIAAQIETSLAA